MWRRPVAVLGGFAIAACSTAGSTAEPAPEAASTTTIVVPSGTSTTTAVAAPSSTTSVPSSSTSSTITSTTTSTTTSSTTTSTLPPVTLPATSTVAPTTVAPATTQAPPAPGSTGSIRDIRPASDIPPPPIPEGWVVESIGTSVQGRDVTSWSRRVDSPRLRVMVVGAVHGNEPASPPTVRALVEVAYPDDVEVWLIPELNPDGVAAGTRWNANGVDLNRNFPWGWRADDGGPAPLSEPETAAVADLILRVDPDLVVWVHQPYGYVSSIGETTSIYEDAWSAGSGLPVRPDVTQHGGGESWTAFHGATPSMLIEIATWAATPEIVAAQRAGFERLLASVEPHPG